MLRQRWQWLWIWVGVLAAGCGQVWSSDRPPSTPQPTLPLLGYTLIPPTLTPTRWPIHTATPLITADTSSSIAPAALHMSVSGSACYETAVGSLVCMGQVKNQWDKAVEQVTVGVQLLASDGTPLATKEALVSRWVLPVDGTGPYRVLFESLPDGYAGARTYIKSGQAVPSTDQSYAKLMIQPASGAFFLDHYNITLSVVNKNSTVVEQITVTMTLLDDNGLVTGFRRIPLEASRQLDPNEALALTIKVIPQGPNTVAFEAFAEGYYVQDY